MTESRIEIVVTGLGAVSAAGNGLGPLVDAISSGGSALRPIPAELAGKEGYLWGRAEDFKASDFLSPLKARKLDRCSQFAVVATGMALKDAGLDPAAFGACRVGIVLGCGFGGIANSEEFLRGYMTSGVEGLVPMLFPNTVPNAPASNASIEYGMKGPNVTFVQRFCSAEAAFQMACRFLEEDRADIILTGGVDELDSFMIEAFRDMGQLRRHADCFSEGAGIIVLEKKEVARDRGAAVRAEVGGVRTVGRLPAGREAEGIARILPSAPAPEFVSLSGVSAELSLIRKHLPSVPTLETGKILGRSLGMGGLAMLGLILSAPSGARALHVGASPEGPFYGIEFTVRR